MNSAAHAFGSKDYDTKIQARENKFVTFSTMGEGYHNYHHVFPFDYSASEVSWTQDVNLSTLIIDCFAALGLAYNLKKVSPKMIKERIMRTGDMELNEVYMHNRTGSFKWHTLTYLFVTVLVVPVSTYYLRLMLSS